MATVPGMRHRAIHILLTIAQAASSIALPLVAQTDRPSAEQELGRIGRLPRAQQTSALKALFQTKDLDIQDPEEFIAQIFEFRQLLAELVSSKGIKEKEALGLLTYLGEPVALRQSIRRMPAPGRGEPDHDLAEDLVAHLIHPATDKDWGLLAYAAKGEFGGAVTSNAIRSLKLNASPRALALLEAARAVNSESREYIEEAINYIRSGATPLDGTDLTSLAARAANAAKRGKLLAVRTPHITRDGQRAIAGFDYLRGCRYSNIAIFHRTVHGWRLQSLFLTTTSHTPPPPPPNQ
ncbi:MAG: hypothetical protein J0L64_05395 [Acidobacteria bacterium]|nr:hypothetical protein [Acidobacteriota bacterium]